MALYSLDFIKACNNFIVIFIIFFEHPAQEQIHLPMEGDTIEVLVASSPSVARV